MYASSRPQDLDLFVVAVSVGAGGQEPDLSAMEPLLSLVGEDDEYARSFIQAMFAF